MTQTQKSKPRAKRPPAAKPTAASAKGQAAGLAAQNAALSERLVAAERRIVELERQRDEALNRIEWVIDAINSLTEDVH
jgi:hypothetical protein